jgi:hypothetical protein
MSEPTVESNLGTVECDSYLAGHNVHWIPVLKKWTNEPRISMTIRHITSNAFEITSEGKTEIVYNHNPTAVIRSIEDAKPSLLKKVGNTGAITIESNRGHAWLYFSNEPFIDCETPQPKYYDKFRYIDKEIARLEELAITAPTIETRIGAKELSLKAQDIKRHQVANAHKTVVTTSDYQSVCTCGLLLAFERKIDVGAGHIEY